MVLLVTLGAIVALLQAMPGSDYSAVVDGRPIARHIVVYLETSHHVLVYSGTSHRCWYIMMYYPKFRARISSTIPRPKL